MGWWPASTSGACASRSVSTWWTRRCRRGTVLNHVGFAIRRIPAEEGLATLKLYHDLLRKQGEEDDLMAADVRAEIEAAGPGWWRNCDTRF